MNILLINGPNLNMLGVRQPEIYGNQSFDSYLSDLKSDYPHVQINYFQSNCEGEIINCIQQNGFEVAGIIINAGAYTHTSVAIADALLAVKVAVIEVHISNVFQRETFRHHSYISPVAKGLIVGFGLDSYRLAIDYLARITSLAKK